MLGISVFVSGRGSNLKSIINSIFSSDIIRLINVISDRKCKASEIASSFSIPFYIVEHSNSEQIINLVKDSDLIVLAGYLRKIPLDIVRSFKNRIINIHPALLPSFGGKGMYGINVHKAVYNASCKVSGATVHFVNESYDEGLIIHQKSVDISDVNSPEEIAEKVLELEHEILPYVIKKFSENKIEIINNRVKIIP